MKTIRPVILASASPRRKELLEKTGLKFNVVESGLKESFDPKLKPQEVVRKLSLEKAKKVFQKYPDSIIIAADTIVAFNNKVIGKPKDENDVKNMLAALNNNSHFIITAFTVINGETTITRHEATKICMKDMPEEEIEKYAKTKEPYDKAGAYAIQGWAKKYITKIDGDESGAIGLPVPALLKELKELGIIIP
jgi:septum formation protein